MDAKLKRALRRFGQDVFTDADVDRCTELSPRSVRELIKLGAVHTRSAERGAGRIRTFDSTMFKRLAVISALHQAGLSLQLAGPMACFPGEHLLYRSHDPISALGEEVGPDDRDHPPRAVRAKWFDPEEPAAVDSEHDWLLEIFDRRFVALVAQGKRVRSIYGDLRKNGNEFVSWRPTHGVPVSISTDVAPKWAAQGLTADQTEDRFLQHPCESHDAADDPLALAAYAAAWRPISTISINVSLVIRLALRRYLGIEPLAGELSAAPAEAKRIRTAKTATRWGGLR